MPNFVQLGFLGLLILLAIAAVLLWLWIVRGQLRSSVKPDGPRSDVRRAAIIGASSGIVYLVLMANFGYLAWLRDGDLLGATVSLMLVCFMPIIQIVVAVGSYIQIQYYRKTSEWIQSVGRDRK